MSGEHRTFSVINGQLQVPDSWVYLWVSQASGLVIYIGATRLDPEVRTWMHLNDKSPDVGRICADYADYKTEPMDVHAFAVSPNINRAAVRNGLIRAAQTERLLAPDHICPHVSDTSQNPEIDDAVNGIIGELRSTTRPQ